MVGLDSRVISIHTSKHRHKLFDCLIYITEDGSADVDALMCGEGQPDYRSILSYGVQEP